MNKISMGLGLAAFALLSACAATVPESGAYYEQPVDSGEGVGFGSYQSYESDRAARERALEAGGTAPILPQPSSESGQAISSSELRAAGLPVDDGSSGAPAPIDTAAVVVDVNNPGISDEQDFQAVSSRVSIETDKERIAAQREAYRVIQPTAVPTRSGSSGANIVAFALSTRNQVGERLYSRSSLGAESKFLRNCAKFASSDLAQQAFLDGGGPEKDKEGLDPDGDGFACYWDPTPFRKVRG